MSLIIRLEEAAHSCTRCVKKNSSNRRFINFLESPYLKNFFLLLKDGKIQENSNWGARLMCATQYHYQFAGSFRRKKAQLSDSTPRHLMYQNDWLMFQTHYFPTKMAVVLFFYVVAVNNLFPCHLMMMSSRVANNRVLP